MAKKRSEVVYTPISDQTQIKTEVEKVDNSELINYKDVGVEYQKYAKVKISNGQYKLLPQESWKRITSFYWGGTNTRLTLSFASVDELKQNNYYITSIVISAVTNLATRFYLDDYATGVNYLYFLNGPGQTQTIIFDFKANPIQVTGENMSIEPLSTGTPSVPQIITGRVQVNIYGFSEQKP